MKYSSSFDFFQPFKYVKELQATYISKSNGMSTPDVGKMQPFHPHVDGWNQENQV